MNILVIPSWYPSEGQPITGIFVQEQLNALARYCPEHNIAVSLWGQMDDAYLLWSAQPLQSFKKYLAYHKPLQPAYRTLLPNFGEYYTPALSWTRRWRRGNIRGIIEANRGNLLAFQERVGKVDVLHAHVAYPAGWVAMELAKEFNIPYLITEHSGPFPMPGFGNGSALSELYNKPLANANAVIAVSHWLANTISTYGIKQPTVIPNIVDELFFVAPSNTAKGSESFIFFTLGRPSVEKGTDLLLHSIALNKDFFIEKKVKFAIGGDDAALPEMKQLARQLEIEEMILWLGPLNREEAASWYKRCNAFVLPSRLESFGVVYAEAMAAGKPVIATRCGGPEDFVVPQTGIMIEKDNQEALSKALEEMVVNYASYNHEQIRQYARDCFSAAVVVPQIVAQYLKISAK